MFELSVVVYLLVHLIYYMFAKKKVSVEWQTKDVLVVLGHPIYTILPKGMAGKLISDQEGLKLAKVHSQKVLGVEKMSYACGKLGLVYLVLVFGGMFGLIFGNQYRPQEDMATVIERPDFGEVPASYNLSYTVASEEGVKEGTMPLVVDAKLPEGNQAIKLLESKFEPLLRHMLTSEGQQNYLTTDLIFDPSPFEDPVGVKYVSLTPEVLTDKGELRRNMMDMDTAYPLALLATLEVNDLQLSFVYNFEAYRAPLTLGEESALIAERVQFEADQVLLPENLTENDGTINWLRPMEGVRGSQVFAASVLLAMVLYVLRKRTLDQAIEQRQSLILRDFPELVSKLTLLINAGMNFNRAWHKVVVDYQARSGSTKPLYEEMVLTTVDLQNGMPERQALEGFGRRTGSKEVIRMSAILSQNIRRGNNALSSSLKQLSNEAWEIRTSNAKILGEKASAKLLLPMGISFITVIIIVLAPTLMSMNL